MADRIKGKVVLITGASAGIGRACAQEFAMRGAKVVCLARRTVEEFDSISADVTDRAAVFAAVEEVKARYGRIDILVNNAGMGISGSVEDTEYADVRVIFDVNFFGALNLIQAVVPVMRDSGGGTIINMSSVAGRRSITFQSF